MVKLMQPGLRGRGIMVSHDESIDIGCLVFAKCIA